MKRLLLLYVLLIIFQSGNSQNKLSDFSTLNFGCDGNSITAGSQWSTIVVEELGFASHHNVAVGSATWAAYEDTQDYGVPGFAGISDGWLPTEETLEIQKRHNNVSKVHIQRFIEEVKTGLYPAPDLFVFSLGTNDVKPGCSEEVLSANTLDSIDIMTMAGGARWAIETLRNEYPQCKIFLCTPIQSGDPERNRLNCQKIVILKEICRAFNVEVIDCYSGSGIMAEFEKPASQGRYLKDGLHPDREGQQLMGNYIANEIRKKYY